MVDIREAQELQREISILNSAFNAPELRPQWPRLQARVTDLGGLLLDLDRLNENGRIAFSRLIVAPGREPSDADFHFGILTRQLLERNKAFFDKALEGNPDLQAASALNEEAAKNQFSTIPYVTQDEANGHQTWGDLGKGFGETFSNIGSAIAYPFKAAFDGIRNFISGLPGMAVKGLLVALGIGLLLFLLGIGSIFLLLRSVKAGVGGKVALNLPGGAGVSI